MRFGPEERALAELAAENKDDLRFEVRAAKGTTAGIQAAIAKATPATRRIYDRSRGALDEIQSEAAPGLSGLVGALAAREAAGSERRVEEARAETLTGLEEQKVQAAQGGAYATREAVRGYKTEKSKIQRQKLGLRGDEAAFTLGTLENLTTDAQKMAMERRRLRVQIQGEKRQQRSLEADLTGRDPATGQLTADERDRRADNRLARQKEARQRDGKKGGPSRGAISRHQTITEQIQEARGAARRLRGGGGRWGDISYALTQPRDKADNPLGGYGNLVTRAAIELERRGAISKGTLRALHARGFLPRRAPRGWRTRSMTDIGRNAITHVPGFGS